MGVITQWGGCSQLQVGLAQLLDVPPNAVNAFLTGVIFPLQALPPPSSSQRLCRRTPFKQLQAMALPPLGVSDQCWNKIYCLDSQMGAGSFWPLSQGSSSFYSLPWLSIICTLPQVILTGGCRTHAVHGKCPCCCLIPIFGVAACTSAADDSIAVNAQVINATVSFRVTNSKDCMSPGQLWAIVQCLLPGSLLMYVSRPIFAATSALLAFVW